MRVTLFMRSVLTCVLAFAGGAWIVPACSGTEPTAMYFDGASLGYCSGFVAYEIPARECGGGTAACTGHVAYALCNGTTYSECACEIPSGYSLDGGIVDGGQGQPVRGVIPFSGTAPPCCAGNVLFEIPGPECAGANCTGNVAYAVCQGNAFSGCSCDPPDGYGPPEDAAPCADN